MINSIKLQLLRGSEMIQLFTDILNIVMNNDPDALMVRAQYDALRSKTNEIELLFKASQGSIITNEIKALDERRDKAINGVTLQIQALTYSADPTVSGLAKVLEAHLNLFGSGIAKDNYVSETTILRNIINDWKTKLELKQAITTLKLTSWQTEIEQANNAFSEAFNRRNDELSMMPLDKLRDLRLQGNELYYNLRNRLNSYMDINEGAEPWGSTINKLNQIISYYVTLLKRRGTSTGEGEPEEEAPTE